MADEEKESLMEDNVSIKIMADRTLVGEDISNQLIADGEGKNMVEENSSKTMPDGKRASLAEENISMKLMENGQGESLGDEKASRSLMADRERGFFGKENIPRSLMADIEGESDGKENIPRSLMANIEGQSEEKENIPRSLTANIEGESDGKENIPRSHMADEEKGPSLTENLSIHAPLVEKNHESKDISLGSDSGSTDKTSDQCETHKLCLPCNELGKKEIAEWLCEKCAEYLCKGCNDIHRAQKLTRDHIISPAGDIELNVDQNLAPETVRNCQTCSELGKDEKALSYCCDCEELLCESCTKRHGAQKICKNHKLITLQEFEQRTQEGINKNCEPCSNMGNTALASSFCNDCEEYLCEGCAAQHRAQKMTRSHNLVSAEVHMREAYDAITFRCEPCASLNVTEEASSFCEDCTEFLCTNCQMKHNAMKMTKHHSLCSTEEYLARKRFADLFLCEPCHFRGQKEKAVSYCIDCRDPEPMCRGCSVHHTAQRSSRDHRISDKLEDLSKTMEKVGQKSTTEKESEGIQRSSGQGRQLPGPATKGMEQNFDSCAGHSKADYAPGKPLIKEIKTDRVSLYWTTPPDFNDNDYYQIRYKNLTEGKWRFYDHQPSEAAIIIKSLRPDTTFVFQVRVVHDDMEGPYSPVSDEVHTKESPANRLLGFSQLISRGPPDLYKLPLTENWTARNNDAKTKKFDLGYPSKRGQEKTIMLVGATGTGKSTLVDGIVNYVLGVNWEDSFRYTLVDLDKEEQNKKKNQAISQTEWVTCYSINLEEGSRLNFRLNIIDTPGFGDTRGLERDQKVIEQIRELFSAKDERGVVFIDAVCFLIKAPDARLTAVQKYIFHAIMSLFGNDIEHNICTMITFADGIDPPVLAAMKEAKLPFGKWFPFNNSGLFAKNTDEANSRTSLSPMFWEMGLRSFRGFFEHLEGMETKSLQLTQEVLAQRHRLELTIQNLQPQVDAGLSKLNELKVEKHIIEQHKTDIEANKNFTYKVTETRQVKHDLPKGQHVTNCLNCNITCHQNCRIPRDEDKARCWAMDKRTGDCTQCPDNCHWKQHANTPYIFEYIQQECTKTYEEKLREYRRAEGEKITHEQVVERMEEDLHSLETDILQKMEDVKQCNEILKQIALRPNPLSMVEHIDMLIQGERAEKKTGFQQRIKVLRGFRKRAEIGKDVHRFQQGWRNARSARGGSSTVVATVVEPSGVRKAYKAFRNFFK